ncbi:zinc finger BED domain-containing protein RICESLEEPER 2-like [Nicotiana tomentosiformis]|uniref:zinc finger BED domain-containing protein RICESLEEPER 2-like n=1 Tax=Nicotiana tomentosiformis TaxID=4098 RepID=UPI00388CA118
MDKAISNCLLEWKLDKVFTITVDNASLNDVTVKELSKKLDMWKTNMMSGKHLHVRCMAHILNLIVQDGLKEIDASVTHLRNIMRWNSTYFMLDMAQNFEKAFDKFYLFDDGFFAYLCSHLCEDGSSASPLESNDWVNVRNVIAFLARFHELTKKVSGSRYVTCNSHFEDVSELYCHLKMCLISEDEHLRKMAEQMQEKFKKYWGEPEKMNKIIFIASVLDPRNKFEYVSLALEELFGEEKGKKINAEVYAYMNSLFEEYLKKYSTGSCPQSPSSSTSSNNTSNTSSGSVLTASLIRTKLHLKKQKEDNGSRGAKSELDKYISEEQEHFSEEFNILSWWKTHAPRFPILSESSLTPKCVQALVYVQDWLREEKNPISVEEDWEYFEELEFGSSAIMTRAPNVHPKRDDTPYARE